jgi:molybdopterin/thiamine biosynthesis adenylyltransferase
MDLSKSLEFFNPCTVEEDLHIIGLGSVGFCVAELLARFGLKRMHLYDFDTVESHNIVNQMYTTEDLWKPKIEQAAKYLKAINPDIELTMHPDGWQGERLSGYVFLCVDDIDLRRKIVLDNHYNTTIKGVFDFRTALTSCQHYAANWKKMEDRNILLERMDFTHEEAMEAVPMSACHVPLCVAPTVRMVANIGVCNFINFVKGKPLHRALVADAFNFMIESI